MSKVSKKKVVRKRYKNQSGEGFLDFAKSAYSKLNQANNFLKENKLISGISGQLAAAGVPFASQVHDLSSKLGYGTKKRRVTRQKRVKKSGSGSKTAKRSPARKKTMSGRGVIII